MINDKVRSLYNKFKELAERGIDGEKVTAREMLDRLMEKHGITIDMIEEETISTRYFKVHSEFIALAAQIATSVTGAKTTAFYKKKSERGSIGFKLTDSQYLELLAKIDFYIPRYKEEQELFYTAFVQKNKLFRKRLPGDQDYYDDDEMTTEERARLWKLTNMMEGLDNHQFHKTLKSGEDE